MSELTDAQLLQRLPEETAAAYARMLEHVKAQRLLEARGEWRTIMRTLITAEHQLLSLRLQRPNAESAAGADGREALGVVFEDRPEWFMAFLNATTQKLVQVGHILQSMSDSQLPTLEKMRGGKGRAAVLGGGTGTSEIQVIAGMCNGKIDLLHFEDPSLEMAHVFRENMLQHNLDVPVDMSLLPLDHPDYSPPENIDLALAIHMFYYVHGWKDAKDSNNPLRKMYDSLSADGTGLVVVQSEQSDNYAFRSEFLPKVHGQQVAALRGEELCDVLEEMSIPHRYEVVNCNTSVQNCFDDSGKFNPNPAGKKLLSFLIRSDWDQISASIQDEIGDYMTQRTNIVHDRRVMNFRDAYIWMLGRGYR